GAGHAPRRGDDLRRAGGAGAGGAGAGRLGGRARARVAARAPGRDGGRDRPGPRRAPRARARGARARARPRRARGDRVALPAMRYLSRADVERLLPPQECIAAMETALVALARGEVHNPLRFVVRPPETQTLMGLMPAYRGGAEPLYALKA